MDLHEPTTKLLRRYYEDTTKILRSYYEAAKELWNG